MSYSPTVLARSEHYTVSHEFETVFLKVGDKPEIKIGDFYGDPEAAIIDSAERWVITVGCGIVLYRLEGSFTPYEYDLKTSQWWEAYRSPPDAWWIESVEQLSESRVRFHVDPHSSEAGVYELDVRSLSVVRVEPKTSEAQQNVGDRPDTARKVPGDF